MCMYISIYMYMCIYIYYTYYITIYPLTTSIWASGELESSFFIHFFELQGVYQLPVERMHTLSQLLASRTPSVKSLFLHLRGSSLIYQILSRPTNEMIYLYVKDGGFHKFTLQGIHP